MSNLSTNKIMFIMLPSYVIITKLTHLLFSSGKHLKVLLWLFLLSYSASQLIFDLVYQHKALKLTNKFN